MCGICISLYWLFKTHLAFSQGTPIPRYRVGGGRKSKSNQQATVSHTQSLKRYMAWSQTGLKRGTYPCFMDKGPYTPFSSS